MNELEQLIEAELKNLKWGNRPQALAAAYQTMGGNIASARRIFQLHIDKLLAEKFAQMDLPGPDSIVGPKVREMLMPAVGELFDKYFAPMGS